MCRGKVRRAVRSACAGQYCALVTRAVFACPLCVLAHLLAWPWAMRGALMPHAGYNHQASTTRKHCSGLQQHTHPCLAIIASSTFGHECLPSNMEGPLPTPPRRLAPLHCSVLFAASFNFNKMVYCDVGSGGVKIPCVDKQACLDAVPPSQDGGSGAGIGRRGIGDRCAVPGHY